MFKSLAIISAITAAALASTLAACVSESMPAPQVLLDRDVPILLTENRVPSVSIAQISGGKVALTAAYGLESADIPATIATLYNTASLTKPLTAEIVLRLASQGAFSLDEPMYRYWTDPDIAGVEWRKELTPRIALSHQTGFPNWRDRTLGLKFLSEPGTKYGYSGEDYEYVARFVEKRTGKNFENMAQAILFDPVGMKDTAYTDRPWLNGRIALPTDASDRPLKPVIAKHFSAADLVYSTPSDYAKFMLAVLSDRELTPEIAKERSRPQVSMMDIKCQGAKVIACPSYTGFGLGWQILQFSDATLMMHTGRDDGVFTFAYLNRSTHAGAVIFTNSDNGDKLVLPILERLGASPPFLRYLQSQL